MNHAATIEAAHTRRWPRLRANPYWVMITPALLLMLVFYVYPVLSVLVISVTEPVPGFANYAMLLDNAPIHRVLLTTARITVITTAITLVLGYWVAYGLVNGGPRTRYLLLFGVVIPLWVSVLIRSFSWIAILRRQGVLNTVLGDLGVIAQPLDLLYNELAVTIGMVHFMLPYAILPLYAGMRTIDGRLVAAALSLGATRVQAFLRVFLPLSAPGILGVAVLVFIFSLGFFVTPAILGGGRTVMVAEYISLQVVETLNWGLGTMIASSLLVSVLLMVVVAARFVDMRRMFGAGA